MFHIFIIDGLGLPFLSQAFGDIFLTKRTTCLKSWQNNSLQLIARNQNQVIARELSQKNTWKVLKLWT